MAEGCGPLLPEDREEFLAQAMDAKAHGDLLAKRRGAVPEAPSSDIAMEHALAPDEDASLSKAAMVELLAMPGGGGDRRRGSAGFFTSSCNKAASSDAPAAQPQRSPRQCSRRCNVTSTSRTHLRIKKKKKTPAPSSLVCHRDVAGMTFTNKCRISATRSWTSRVS